MRYPEDQIVGSITVEVTVKKSYKINIYGDMSDPQQYALEVARERLKDDDELFNKNNPPIFQIIANDCTNISKGPE